jgi:hypothetical protein
MLEIIIKHLVYLFKVKMTMKNILKITQKPIQIIIKIMEEILAIDSLPKLLIS